MLAKPKLALRAALFVIVFSVTVLSSVAAGAHVALQSSTPENVSTVGPTQTVTFTFSGTVDPVKDEFKLTDETGAQLKIKSVTRPSEQVVAVEAEEPFPAGRNKASWASRAADGHVMTGSIAFTIDPLMASTAPAILSGDGNAAPTTESSSTNFSFAELLASLGRWIVYAAILFCVGALAYAQFVHEGLRRESRSLIFFIRRAAIVVVFGAVLEWFAQLWVRGSNGIFSIVSPSAWGDVISSNFATGSALRVIGALVLLLFLTMSIEDVNDNEQALNSISGTTITAPAMTLTKVKVSSSPLAIVGATLLLCSELFLGHTASVQPRFVTAISDFVHLATASVWCAGAWLLFMTLVRRKANGISISSRVLAAKFSSLATVSVITVSITGVILSYLILDGFGGIFSTQFGKFLIVKLFLVAILIALGAYNRWRLVPQLQTDQESFTNQFRLTMLAESVVFLAIVLVTALLVASSPLA